jgi:hypothetical protein
MSLISPEQAAEPQGMPSHIRAVERFLNLKQEKNLLTINKILLPS